MVGERSELRNGARDEGDEEHSGFSESRMRRVRCPAQASDISFCSRDMGFRRALMVVVTPRVGLKVSKLTKTILHFAAWEGVRIVTWTEGGRGAQWNERCIRGLRAWRTVRAYRG